MKPIKAEYQLIGGEYGRCVWQIYFPKSGDVEGALGSRGEFKTESGCRRNMKRYAAKMNIELHPFGSLR